MSKVPYPWLIGIDTLLLRIRNQQSCTAGRAAFITGQSPIRTGLTKVGLPGANEGLRKEDPTLPELLKPYGYVCGQFGKNDLGDRNEFLPTVHGFDELFGNLYHLNAEEEPENLDYPKDPAFKARFGPRGVLHCFASDTDDPTVDPRFGRVGKQTIEDTGPLTKKRMEKASQASRRQRGGKYDEPINVTELVSEVDPIEKYYNDLFAFDRERNVLTFGRRAGRHFEGLHRWRFIRSGA